MDQNTHYMHKSGSASKESAPEVAFNAYLTVDESYIYDLRINLN